MLPALAAYVKNKSLRNGDLRFVATLQDSQYVEAANIAGEGRADIVFAKDAIAGIISNTCRQHGLAQVLTELFSFSGDELYFESVPRLEGKTFKEADSSAICNGGAVSAKTSNDLLVLGSNEKLPIILDEYAKYVQPGTHVPVDSYVLTESAARRGEIYLGYRNMNSGNNVIVNPRKDELITFGKNDQIVVIADN